MDRIRECFRTGSAASSPDNKDQKSGAPSGSATEAGRLRSGVSRGARGALTPQAARPQRTLARLVAWVLTRGRSEAPRARQPPALPAPQLELAPLALHPHRGPQADASGESSEGSPEASRSDGDFSVTAMRQEYAPYFETELSEIHMERSESVRTYDSRRYSTPDPTRLQARAPSRSVPEEAPTGQLSAADFHKPEDSHSYASTVHEGRAGDSGNPVVFRTQADLKVQPKKPEPSS